MKKSEGGGVSAACKLGEIAGIICADEVEGFSGVELLARAIATRPPNEDRIRGIA